MTVLIALLYDIHGNLPALDVVLADAREQGAREFLLGGDYALFGPYPRETVERLQNLEERTMWVRGNVDRWAAHPADAPDHPLPRSAIAACRRELGEALTDELGRLQEQLVAKDVRFCHASPLSDVRSFLPEPAADEPELLHGVTEPRVVFGHTHLPFQRLSASGISLVNPGSVGIPLDGDPRAAYALWHYESGEVEHRRVEYDFAASARAMRERFAPAPFAETIASRIETARMETG